MNAMEGLIAALKESVQEHENTQAWLYRKAKEKSRPLQDIIDRSNEVIARATEPEGAILKSEAQVKELREAVRKLFNPITFGQKKLIIDKVLASTGTDHLEKELVDVNDIQEILKGLGTKTVLELWGYRCPLCHEAINNHVETCKLAMQITKYEKRKAELERGH